jgi:two-component system OmpR family response regulator
VELFGFIDRDMEKTVAPGETPMKILVIEDDKETLDFIVKGLAQAGHTLEAAQNGRDGIFMAIDGAYDVVIVDRLLPVIDGVSLVRTLRGANLTTPILFLTTMGDVDDRVEGLDAGGDDYLVKPFAFSELRARVDALCRRPPPAKETGYLAIGDLEMDLIRRTVKRGGQVIELQPLEFRLLEYLMRNAGRVVTQTMLLERVWEYHFDPKTKIVEANVSRLRAKLDRPFCAPMLRTIRGAGYVLDVPDGPS